MIAFMTASENLPFTIALGLMVGIGLLEGITTLLGFGASSFLDSLIPDMDMDIDLDADLDLDADGPHISEMGSPGALSRLLGWFHVGRVPVLILFILFLFCFGMLGLFIQSFTVRAFGWMIPGFFAVLITIVPAFFSLRIFGGVLGKMLPKDETESVSEKSFIGKVAVITMGIAKPGKPAQARVKDKYNRSHYIMVVPEENEPEFPAGTRVLLIRQTGATFHAISNPNEALVDNTK